MRKLLLESFGWYGTFSIIGAYGATSFGLLQPTDITYQLLNLTGALGIAIISFAKKTYQPAVLNFIWALIAVFALFNLLIH